MTKAAMIAVMLTAAAPAAAQDVVSEDVRPAMRTRVMLGPQIAPRYPGADNTNILPFINIDRSRQPEFPFEAPDESGGLNLIRSNGFAIGPALNFQGSRRRRDTDGLLPKVGFTVEVGGSVQYTVNPNIRLRAEARRGIGGHKAWVGLLSADYVARDADRWLFSLGPRLTLSERKFNRAYFGVSQADSLTSGIAPYDPKGGIQAVGAAASALRQLGSRWGVYGYAKYDRLVGDPADSPVVRRFGSRNQLSAGVALSYTFGG
ncbi:hypothetical protein GCM10011380_05300 [Sphingomonas metalli]|uniref:MipA/OmpV family protein n=1 Tax=Sphingomonas metalli TaxID=1779358 RepID=A0A916SUT6_9SPHN|nr:MipA/OmpV family protein [Sphingomonas metalli]GGB18672.1 hypothetical protein GCM10011380_05300 [Sphingomonas metalli]